MLTGVYFCLDTIGVTCCHQDSQLRSPSLIEDSALMIKASLNRIRIRQDTSTDQSAHTRIASALSASGSVGIHVHLLQYAMLYSPNYFVSFAFIGVVTEVVSGFHKYI